MTLRRPEPPVPDDEWSEKRGPLILLVAFLVAVAWLNRFIQDDAFISFRYASNLVSGHGLTWNPGEPPVAGYSTFLWTVLVSSLLWLGVDPVIGSWALGLALFAGTLTATAALARDLLGKSIDAMCVVVVLGTNYTFLAWATGGMETQLQAFLVVTTTRLVFDVTRVGHPPRLQLAFCSVLLGLLLLTRLDSAVVVGVLGTFALTQIWYPRRARPLREAIVSSLTLVIPGALIALSWLAWCYAYYGDILPNTYYVKLATSNSMFRGLHYVYRFLAEYWILPLGLLLLLVRPSATIRAYCRPGDRRVTAIGILLLAWCAYVVRAGGDFMEFRFLVAVLPLFVVWLWRGFSVVYATGRLRTAAVVTLVIASALHAVTFRGSLDIESIAGLAVHLAEAGGDWDEIGRSLSDLGGEGPDLTIAVGAAGAIPYYSGLRTIDMRGLNDRWVARHGHAVGTRPGHQRMAPFTYLVDQRVNLVIGHPLMSARDAQLPDFLTVDALSRLGLVDATEESVPGDARFVVIPVGSSLRVTALYLRSGRRDRSGHRRRTYQRHPIEKDPLRQPSAHVVRCD